MVTAELLDYYKGERIVDKEYIAALTDLVQTFLNFSDECLEENVINETTYVKITENKKKFLQEMKKSRDSPCFLIHP